MAKTPKSSAPSKPGFAPGFEEAPQSEFEGAPISGSVSDWVKQLEAEAEAAGVESQRELASKAGKHRKKIEIEARRHAEKVALDKAQQGRHFPAAELDRLREFALARVPEAFADALARAGLERVEYFNLAAGAVAVHRGYKLG